MRKLFVILLLALAPFGAAAKEYTDVYYDPAESGWGVFLVQSDATMFIAFFIYGADGKPTWYTATLNDDGTGTNTYTGALYATTGSPFSVPWNPAQLTITASGSATFQAVDNYHATLTYVVTGSATVVRSVQRQTLTGYTMDGVFSGSMA